MKTAYLLFATGALGTAALIIACGGAETLDVLGAPAQATGASSGSPDAASGGTSGKGTSSSSGTSGTSSSGTSGTSSSSGTSGTSSGDPGDACAQCDTPPAGCSYPNPCDCTLKCPDSGGPVTCDWKVAGSCPDGSFCDANNCSSSGQCVKKPQVEQVQRDPQCGCDNVTYWNTSVARTVGVPVKSNGACGNDSAKCGGLVGTTCPGSASCNHPVKNKNQCTLPDATGTCWKLPAVCPPSVDPRSHSCTANKCTGECDAIRNEAPWYDDSNACQ